MCSGGCSWTFHPLVDDATLTEETPEHALARVPEGHYTLERVDNRKERLLHEQGSAMGDIELGSRYCCQ